MRRGTPRLYNNNNIYKMKILLFDNYDSFTYNLLHILKELGADVEVHRNDKISLEEIERFDKIYYPRDRASPRKPASSSP